MSAARRVTACAVILLGVGCGDGPTGTGTPEVELEILAGDGQFARAGEELSVPLAVSVTERATGEPVEDVEVAWSVDTGGATFPSGSVSVSDASGVATVSVRLEGAQGEVSIRAEVLGRPEVAVVFSAWVIDRPTLQALSSTAARGGEAITLTGTDFSPVPVHNVVLFSGIRGRVLGASTTALEVEVPSCLPTRTVQVTAQLGTLVSGALSLAVEEGSPQLLDIPARGRVDVDDAEGFTCVALPGAGGAAYLLVGASTGTVGAARYRYSLRGLSSSTGVARGAYDVSEPDRGSAVSLAGGGGPQIAFETTLRLRESELTLAASGSAGIVAAAPAQVPSVGDRRTFKVLQPDRTLADATAVARYVGARAVLYVDEAAPSGGLTVDDLAAFSAQFDEVIQPTVTGVFGQASDLDANERIVVLFTPAVNRLTERGSSGFVGGYFYGLDLLDQEGSNRGEVFYMLVPDPQGTFSDPHSKTQVLEVTPGILAHEFQHMIHFNQRVLLRGAGGTEALWLSEGLAQMSEELVARAYEELGDTRSRDLLRSGNLLRARRFLASTSAASLIVGTGQGTLEERGAGWLFVLYLWDRLQRDATLAALTATTRTGVANVQAVAGGTWRSWLTDWAGALYLDDLSSQPYDGEYPSVSLRTLVAGTGGAYPISPEVLGFGDFARSGDLWSSSAAHYIVVPPGGGRVVLRFAGRDGAAAPSDSGLRLRIVRLF